MLRPRQKLFVERSLAALDNYAHTLGVAPTGCHAAGALIMMHDGSIRAVETIAVGDLLMGPGGTPRRVLELHRGHDQMVEIRPLKGDPFTVNLGHILTLVRTNEGKLTELRDRDGELVDISVTDWLAASHNFRHLHKLLRVPVDFPGRPAPAIDPYFLGVMLGDGSLIRSVSITTPDVEIVEAIHHFAKTNGLRVRCEQLSDNAANTYFLLDDRSHRNELVDQLRELGLFGKLSADKFIPDDYRLGSREVRLEMLAGLLDTDGHLSNGRCFEYSSKSRQLAADVVFIARSLGFLATSSEKEVNGHIYMRVNISGDLDKIANRVLRKQAPPRRMKKNVLRCGFTAHPAGEGEYFGFTVDGDHRYLMGDFTVTHNSGKTVMLSAVTGAFLTAPDARACVLAHRDELTEQNRAKFGRINPAITTSVVDANEKSWDAQATFAMVPTLSRKANLDEMPDLDLLVIDEAHHAVADSYRRIIERARVRNPEVKVFGVTATPNRGDKQGLRDVFDNVADQIFIQESISSGHLVKPRSFVVNVGVQEALKKVRRVASDFDMNAVAEIMDKSPVTDQVISHWKEKAGERQTVVFCSTVEHAQNVAAAFRAAGIKATTVHGEMSDAERKATLGAYAKGRIQVITNVAVLTEGWDHPPTSCVVLLRPSSYKSTMIQMVGRGLRTVNPEEYPGVVKTDCIILDFGTSSLIHGSLEQDVNLKGHDSTEDSTQTCHSCSAVIPLSCSECPICGETLIVNYGEEEGDGLERQRALLSGFDMTEIDLLARSSFEWVDLFGDGASLVANGFNAWAGIFAHNGRWYGVGGAQHKRSRLLAVGEELVCLAAADDWLNTNETNESAHKTKGWLNQPPTEKQLAWLPEKFRLDYGLTRYRASALLTFKFNKTRIQELIMDAAEAAMAEAA
jgi:superfamily II DNA or RNA helicase